MLVLQPASILRIAVSEAFQRVHNDRGTADSRHADYDDEVDSEDHKENLEHPFRSTEQPPCECHQQQPGGNSGSATQSSKEMVQALIVAFQPVPAINSALQRREHPPNESRENGEANRGCDHLCERHPEG